MEHMELIYNSYRKMKKMEIMGRVIALQAIAGAPPDRIKAVLKAAVNISFVSLAGSK